MGGCEKKKMKNEKGEAILQTNESSFDYLSKDMVLKPQAAKKKKKGNYIRMYKLYNIIE